MAHLSGKPLALFEAYLQNWFCRDYALADMCGVAPEFLDELTQARAAPGVVYRMDREGHVWSALSAYLGEAQQPLVAPVAAWRTPAAAAWIRQAALLQQRPEKTAALLQGRFADDYQNALQALPAPLKSYGEQIGDAADAWDAWVKGAYAVCMRAFSANAVVEKLTRRLRARELINVGADALTLEEKQLLLEDITRLSEILTPFAPFERNIGTPGTVIDRGLAMLGLGTENPFGDTSFAPLLEAC